MTKASADEIKTKKKKIKSTQKFRKAPNAPRRFKSAFIFYSQSRHPVIGAKLRSNNHSVTAAEVAKIVAKEWRGLSPDDKAYWETKASKDKKRYYIENSIYTGPHKVPVSKQSKKDPNAPKRPMSAFLAYSKDMRSSVQSKNPHLSNTDISKVLGKQWKAESDDIKHKYRTTVEEQMTIYNDRSQTYREKKKHEEDEQRKQREEMAVKLMDSGVTMMPCTQIDHDNHSYTQTFSCPFLAQKGAQPVNEHMERNSSSSSQVTYYEYNQEHFMSPFEHDRRYKVSYWENSHLSQGHSHGHNAWHCHQQFNTDTHYNEYYHHHENKTYYNMCHEHL